MDGNPGLWSSGVGSNDLVFLWCFMPKATNLVNGGNGQQVDYMSVWQ